MAVTIFAAIDIGSYEVSMKIFEMSKKIGLHELNHVRYGLELGKDVYATGKPDVRKMDALCEILLDFKNIMKEFGVDEYRVCGTSAFREVRNADLVIDQIYRRTGLQIEILSNAEQHFLGYKSIAAIETGFRKIIQKGTAILDVGGGSLQISLFDKDTLVTTQSLKIGSVRIRERLRSLEKETIHYDQLIDEFIRNDLIAFRRLFLKDRDIKNIILMGDLLTDTIFREQIQDKIITREEFSQLCDRLNHMSEQEMADKLEIDPEHASLVLPTVIVCRSILELLSAESMWVPGVALTDGMAYDFGEKRKLIRSAHNFENDILVASRNIAKRYSSAEKHLQGTSNVALTIFDSMKKIHGMGARERLLLQIAVLLHDCGKYISMGDVAECSYRIITATEIIGLSTRERQIIANAVRYNTVEFGDELHRDEEQQLDKDDYLLVAKLTAILRLANAMDRSHYQKIEGLRAVLKDRELSLVIDSSRDVSLELGLLKSKLEFFEEVFGVHVVLRRAKKRK
jgi:exopolyphosphatase/guanosine-5'-triphosphate,3'-diphosphate pyrophosphatase